jgi:hypothetical protein
MYHPSIFRSPRGHHEKQRFEFGTSQTQIGSITVSSNLFSRRSSSSCQSTEGVATHSAKRWDRFVIRPRRRLPHSAFSLRCFPMQVTKYRYSATQLKDNTLNAVHHFFTNLRGSFSDRDKWFPLFSQVSSVALGLPRFLFGVHRANKMAGQWTCMLTSMLHMCGVIPPTPQTCMVFV